jgi:cytochrome b subunit of formate dehydrogenase
MHICFQEFVQNSAPALCSGLFKFCVPQKSQEVLQVRRSLHPMFTPQFSVQFEEFQQKISSNFKNHALFSEYKYFWFKKLRFVKN